MNLKDKFRLNSQKFQQKKIEEREGKEFESFEYLDSFNDKKTRFIPPVDYTKFQNFVRFGLAEEYVEASFDNILNNYPYDGSKKEKIDWENSATPYNLHIFEKKYPRTTGYINCTAQNWAFSGSDSTRGETFFYPTIPEYISIKGGPNKDNIYDPTKNRNSNLALNLSSSGDTIELWYKLDQSFGTPIDQTGQTIFEAWNGEEGASKGLVTLYGYGLQNAIAADGFLRLRIQSGSAVDTLELGNTSILGTIREGDWNHIAVSYQNQTASLYFNGALNTTDTTTSSFGDIGGAIRANIGGFVSGSIGAGKLIGSMDEFRFWKTARTDQEIGQNWYTQVYGGTNTDDANTDLGVYFKFNEGITGQSSLDSVVLDYSGRVSNGTWTGYSSGSRSTGSAIVEAGAADAEFRDPILYNTHPSFQSSKSELITFAKRYDNINQSSFYDLFPGYLIDEDEQNGGGLKKLIQVMASYLDTLQLQIDFFNEAKNVNYYGDFRNSDVKQIPFIKEQIIDKGFYIDDLFLESDLIESLSNKTYFDNFEFEKELYEVKNLIYQNFYNNLNSIVKSKGTLKSIRNSLRTFGVDEDLISVEKFADNASFVLNDTREAKTTKRKFLRFNKVNNTESCIYNYGTTVSDSVITGTFASSSLTFETEVMFPAEIQARELSGIYKQQILTGSIFGVQSANAALNTTIPDSDADIKVLFERLDTTPDSGTRFVLTSSNASIPTLSSSYFFNVYDDSHWNFAVRIRPNYFQSTAIQKTGSIDYELSFYGVCNYGDRIIETFNLTSSLDKTAAETLIAKNKRVYAGAFNENITGSNVYKTDIKLGNVRAWIGFLDDETLNNHAIESNNLGTKGNYLSSLTLESEYKDNITKNNTILFNWNFDFNNAFSGSRFLDVSSGPVFEGSPAINDYPAAALGFESNPTGSLSTDILIDYVVSEPEKQLRENDISFDKREIEEQRFSKNQKFVDYSFIVKKSPYGAINKEILKYYTAIKDFHNFIGAPVNKYRDEYKELRRERELFFKKISNEINVEKFIKFYKWVDSGLSTIIYQLIPESVKFDPEVLTLIESHVLERPKYKNKFPTIEFKKRDPIDSAEGVNKLLINWKFNHAPIPAAQNTNCQWWNLRANRSGSVITSGDSGVDADREQIRVVKLSAVDRSYTTPQSFKIDEVYTGKASRKANYWDAAIQEFGRIVDVDGPGPLTASVSTDYLLVKADNVYEIEDCLDVLKPNKKVKKAFKVENSREYNGSYSYGKGHLLAPFTLWSSSVDTGYQTELGTNFKSNIGLNNHHDDNYSNFVNAPLQSPFTQGWVGGRQYRHIALNNGSDANGTRPEGFYLLAGPDQAGSASLGVVKTTYTSDGTHDFNTPRASFFREELAKRPVNIKNRQYSTSSSRLGNFRKTYEVVMTNGRTKNNLWFHDNASQVLTETEVWSLNRGTTSPYLNATLPTRGVVKSVIVNRFSAPGGPEVQSRGYLEPTGEELSPYNAYPFRNTSVLFSSGSNNNDFTGSDGPRVNIYTNIHTNNDGLRVLLSRHSGKFGVDSVYGSVRAEDYNTTASYIKVNRNPISQSTGINYDNFFATHQIPRTPAGYSWIRAIQDGTSGSFAYSRNATRPSGSTSEAVPFTQLATSIQQGDTSEYNRAFTGLLSGSTPTSAYLTSSLLASIIDQGSTEITNELTINSLPSQSFGVYSHGINNSIFGYGSFSQIRGGETIQGRSFRRDNKIPITIVRSLSNGNTLDVAAAYNEPAILKKFSPFKHTTTTLVSEEDERISNITYSYLNNKYFYSNTNLNNLLNKNNVSVYGTYDIVKRSYDRGYYLDDGVSELRPTPSKFKYLITKEVIFPKAENTFLKEHRGRTSFTVDWWKSSRTERNEENRANSYNFTFDKQSIWGLDGLPDDSFYSSLGPVSGGYATSSEGELQAHRNLFFKTYLPGPSFATDNLLPSPTYARPALSGALYPKGAGKFIAGITPWSAAAEAGKEPFYYSDYDAYHEKIRLVGQDHTIVPEFRISNHIEQIEQAGGDALVALDDLLSIEGGEAGISSSSQPRFYEEFSHTDFLQYFNAVKDDLSKFNDDGRTEKISLECKAIMKLLPYEGFYPVQRTQQIAQLFSQSYGPALETPGSASFRVLQTPFFGPGILYNSIKSGISLPFPINTSSAGAPTSNVAYTGVGSSETYPYKFISGSFTDNFSNYFKYLNFESILNPQDALSPVSGDEIYDYETLIEASASGVSALIQSGYEIGDNYKFGINNFLAESLSFFNNKEKSGILLSNDYFGSLDTSVTYSMDIQFNEIVENYSRNSAFGAPISGSDTTYGDSYHFYVPPYRKENQNKNIKALRISYAPESEEFDVDHFLANYTASYVEQDGTEVSQGTLLGTRFVAYTDMVNLMKVPLTINDTTNRPAFGIGIQPKWQSPILDFSARTASVPSSENQDFYSTGMWHQYGALPPTDKTVEVKVVKSSNTSNENLAEVLGLADKSINIGHLPDKKEVKEAVIAVPFIQDGNSNERNFFKIDKRYISDAERQLSGAPAAATNDFKAGRSIVDMVQKMKNYVLPPRLDFLTYKEVEPVAMYVFEFSHTFSKQDLADIWQNLPPTSTQFDQDITTGFKVQTSKLSYYTNYSPEAVEQYGSELPVFDNSLKGENVRWFVFKVKQRAATNYFDTLASVPMETDSIKERYPMVDKIPYSIPELPAHSYNWPYDYFSMVELIKMEAQVNFGKGFLRDPEEYSTKRPEPQAPEYSLNETPDGNTRRAPGDPLEGVQAGDSYFADSEAPAGTQASPDRRVRPLNGDVNSSTTPSPDSIRRRR